MGQVSQEGEKSYPLIFILSDEKDFDMDEEEVSALVASVNSESDGMVEQIEAIRNQSCDLDALCQRLDGLDGRMERLERFRENINLEVQEVRQGMNQFRGEINLRLKKMDEDFREFKGLNNQRCEEQFKFNGSAITAITKLASRLPGVANADQQSPSLVSATTASSASTEKAASNMQNCKYCRKLLAASYLNFHVRFHCPRNR